MRLLFVSYWGVREGLTSATVLPHLKILSRLSAVEKILFCSIERNGIGVQNLGIEKVEHIPLFSLPSRSILLTKFTDFNSFSVQIMKLCKESDIDLIICRSPMAGAIGYMVWKRTKIPYIVESFEPHADSMLESGVWKRFDPRLWIQKYFEFKQKRTAKMILPVSDHYFTVLLKEGIEEGRIVTMPCCISLSDFEFDPVRRIRKRAELKIQENEIVGIYVGKFGGIYYDDEAFSLFKSSFIYFGESFRLVILSADNYDDIIAKMKKYEIPLHRIHLSEEAHKNVPDYLSAADFAFSTIKPVSSRLYCSPIKNGEYWANGLPILTEYGIGDDSDIIMKEGGGIILSMSNPNASFADLQGLLNQGRLHLAKSISKIAYRHRRLELVEDIYKSIIVDKD